MIDALARSWFPIGKPAKPPVSFNLSYDISIARFLESWYCVPALAEYVRNSFCALLTARSWLSDPDNVDVKLQRSVNLQDNLAVPALRFTAPTNPPPSLILRV